MDAKRMKEVAGDIETAAAAARRQMLAQAEEKAAVQLGCPIDAYRAMTHDERIEFFEGMANRGWYVEVSEPSFARLSADGRNYEIKQTVQIRNRLVDEAA